MGFLDDKGRLFGKVNVIDFLVVLFLCFFIPVLFFSYKISKKKPAVSAEYADAEIECTFAKVDPHVAERIAVGDTEKDKDGVSLAEIVWVGESKPYTHKFNLGGGQSFFREDSGLKEVPVKLKLIKPEIRNGEVLYKNKRVLVGSPIEFKTEAYALTATTVTAGYDGQWMNVAIKFTDIDIEESGVLKKGDVIKDYKGMVIGELVEVKSNKPSQLQTLVTGAGGSKISLAMADNPLTRDVVALFRLYGAKKDEGVFFNNSVLKVGNAIKIETAHYMQDGTIIDIERAQ